MSLIQRGNASLYDTTQVYPTLARMLETLKAKPTVLTASACISVTN